MRFFTSFLIAIGLIILIFVIILKSSGPSKPPLNLNNYVNTDATVQLLIDGPINADQAHQQIQMTVSSDLSTIQMLQGYQGVVSASKSYQNNETSFDAFIHALSTYGFTKGTSSTNLSTEAGSCAIGERYIFTVQENGSTLAEYWSTSCGGGTFGGDLNGTISLMEAQFPDFGTITDNFIY